MDATVQSARDRLLGMYCAWVTAVVAFQVANHALLDCVPKQEQVKAHQDFLAVLILTGRMFEAGFATIDAEDLLPAGISRRELSAQIIRLEITMQEIKDFCGSKN
jgi:hypothetical protein